MACQKLVLKLVILLVFEDMREVAEFVGARGKKLVDVDELRDLLSFC